MKSYSITTPAGSLDFNYTVGTGTGEDTSTNTGTIYMDVLGSSVSYSGNDPLDSVTNKKSSTKQVIGTVTLQLSNSITVGSVNVYIKLSGTANSNYYINKIGTDDYSTTPYVWGSYSATAISVPAATDETHPGTTTFNIEVGYTGEVAGDKFTFSIIGNEGSATDNAHILGTMPTINITSTFANLSGSFTLVDQYNRPITNTSQTPVSVYVNDVVYYLTSIENSGNAATLIGTVGSIFAGTLDKNHFGTQTLTIYYGPTLDIETAGTKLPIWSGDTTATLTTNGTFSYSLVEAIAAYTTLNGNGKYYICVKCVVTK